MIKAIFFDIDGTLIRIGGNCMPKDTIDALNALKEKGIKIFLASGRGVRELEVVTKDVKFDGCITLNGQICVDEENRMYFGNPIHEEDLKVLLGVFERREKAAIIIEEHRTYINYIDEAVIEMQKKIGVGSHRIGSYQGDTVYQAILYADEKYADDLFKKLPHCKWSRWNPEGIDVFSKDGGKMTGIKKTLEYFGISQDETMAFGDADNDVDMLKYVKIGVAMGNAQQETKDAADYVTESQENGGISKALKHFGIIECK